MAFYASCGKGLENLLADELQALGAGRCSVHVAGVAAEGDLVIAQRAVLWSRFASRITWPLTEFACADEAALYAGARAVDWTQHLDAGMTFAINAHVSGEGITHGRFAAQRVKDAVVDTLRDATGERPNVDVESPDVLIDLVVRKGRAVLSVDLGGGAMHRRGWRSQQGEAPLKETLAAAVLTRGGWPKKYQEGGGLLDPMCGSGTLVIEAALMAADVAPGLQRHGEVPPTRWKGFDADAWREDLQQARARSETGLSKLQAVFAGFDLDVRAVRMARENAEAAGVASCVHFDIADIGALSAPAQATGLVACNPPYDARLQADPALYRALGDALRRAVPAWTASLLCGDETLARATGLRAKKRYTVFNGALECTLLVAEPVLLQREETTAPALSEGAQMVANRIEKNLRKLKSWRQRDGITCFRAYDADIPEYSAAVDVYTTEPDAQSWLHVQEYAAPSTIPEAVSRRRFGELLSGAREAFNVPRERVATKTRMSAKGGGQYGRFAESGQWLQVREGAAMLEVNLFDYLDTGLFLDHRPMRLRIARESRGRRFLNLFCYTGVATVQAAVGGAASTVSVDLSATYLEWLERNLALNGIGGANHELVQADVMRWLESDRGEYDLVFCDPPTFSNSKRAEDFDVQRDHARLLETTVARLAPDGVLYFSNNFRRFKLDEAALSAFAHVEEISADTLPPDFARNPRIHRAWRITRKR